MRPYFVSLMNWGLICKEIVTVIESNDLIIVDAISLSPDMKKSHEQFYKECLSDREHSHFKNIHVRYGTPCYYYPLEEDI